MCLVIWHCSRIPGHIRNDSFYYCHTFPLSPSLSLYTSTLHPYTLTYSLLLVPFLSIFVRRCWLASFPFPSTPANEWCPFVAFRFPPAKSAFEFVLLESNKSKKAESKPNKKLSKIKKKYYIGAYNTCVYGPNIAFCLPVSIWMNSGNRAAQFCSRINIHNIWVCGPCGRPYRANERLTVLFFLFGRKQLPYSYARKGFVGWNFRIWSGYFGNDILQWEAVKRRDHPPCELYWSFWLAGHDILPRPERKRVGGGGGVVLERKRFVKLFIENTVLNSLFLGCKLNFGIMFTLGVAQTLLHVLQWIVQRKEN